MIQTIRVKTTEGKDTKGEGVLHDIHELSNNKTITDVQTTTVYRLEGITVKQAIHIAEKLLCESINQTYTINRPLLQDLGTVIEIGYKPGVMNPEVASLLKSSQDLGMPLLAADTSHEYGFYGKIPQEKLLSILETIHLYNPTIEQIVTHTPLTLLIKGIPGKTRNIPLRSMTDEQLEKQAKDTLFLSLSEMRTIQSYFQHIRRDPTDCELETLAQTWSEHCAHKTFKAQLVINGKKKKPLMERLKKEALKHDKHIVSAFIDNSGVMDFYDGYAICGKVETHNSPSAIEPYGGAMTGSGGVFRDILGTGKGAKSLASTDIFCFGNPDMDYHTLPSGCLPPAYLLKRVVAGVRDYGNRMGIPTNNGSVHFHDDFRAKPTVIVGAYGILPKSVAQKGSPKAGDLLIAIGGKTGRDGIHGATFSSAAMTEKTMQINSSAVQIGNAIEEKRMFDALILARDKDMITALQDCGAGGFSSAIGELGEKTGVTVHLDKAPLKYAGLSPWEIWVSESQERMVAAVKKNKKHQFLALCAAYNVEATVLGVFDKTKKLNIYFGKEQIASLSMDFLHHGLPRKTMIGQQQKKRENNKVKEVAVPINENQWQKQIQAVLSHPTICSKEPIVRLYDHSVQGTNDLQSYTGVQRDGPNDATVLRPFLDKPYGMILAHGLHPILNRIDPFWGSIWAATEAIANYVSVGGNYKDTSLINNYIWPVPTERMLYALDQSVDAVIHFMKTMKLPVISGKDSLSSTYKNSDGTIIEIPPVLCMSVFGKIPDTTKTISADLKLTESFLYFIGKQDTTAMGGSVYFENNQVIGSTVPKVDLIIFKKICDSLFSGIQKKQILSCHDVSEGGLLTTIFEMCIGGNMGATLDLTPLIKKSKKRPDYLLFNETAGCFIIEVTGQEKAEKLLANVPHVLIGKTRLEEQLSVFHGTNMFFDLPLHELKKAWQEPMKKLFP